MTQERDVIFPPQVRPSVRKNTYKGGNVYDNNDSENTNTKVANTENKAKNLSLKKDGNTTPRTVDPEKVPVLDEASSGKDSDSNPKRNEKVAVAKNVEKNVNVDVGDSEYAGPGGRPPPAISAQQQGTTFLPGGVMPVGMTDIVFPDIIITNSNDINNANENQNKLASSNENLNQNPNDLTNENAAIAEQNFAENNFMFSEEKNFYYLNAPGDIAKELPPCEGVTEVPSLVTQAAPLAIVGVETTHKPCITCPPTTELIPVTHMIPTETAADHVQLPCQTIIEQIQLPGQTYIEQLPGETIIEQIQLPGHTFIEKVPGPTCTERLPGETIIEQVLLPGKTFYEQLPGETVIEKVMLPAETFIEQVVLPCETVTKFFPGVPTPVTVKEKEEVYITKEVEIPVPTTISVPGIAIPWATTVTEEVILPCQVVTKFFPGVPTPVTVKEEKEIYITKEVEIPVPITISVPGIAIPWATTVTEEVVLPGQVVTKFFPSVPTPVTVKEKEEVYITKEVEIPTIQEVFVTKERVITSLVKAPGIKTPVPTTIIQQVEIPVWPVTEIPRPSVEATRPIAKPAPPTWPQAPKAPVPVPGVEVEIGGPEVNIEIQSPKFEIEIEGPKVEIEIESPKVEIEIEGPEVEIEIENSKAEAEIEARPPPPPPSKAEIPECTSRVCPGRAPAAGAPAHAPEEESCFGTSFPKPSRAPERSYPIVIPQGVPVPESPSWRKEAPEGAPTGAPAPPPSSPKEPQPLVSKPEEKPPVFEGSASNNRPVIAAIVVGILGAILAV